MNRIMDSEAGGKDTTNYVSGNGRIYSQDGQEKQEYNMSSFDINDEYGSEDTLLVSTPLLGDRDSERVRPQGGGTDSLYFRITTGFSWIRRRKWRVLCGQVALQSWIIKHRLILSLLFLISSASFIFRQYYHEPHLKADEWRRHCASQPTFQAAQYISSEPVGILVGVMSMATESAAKRRMEIRQSWASHWASRGRWDEGQVWSPDSQNMTNPTSRVVVRFVLGRPEQAWRESIRQEMNQYNDIIIVPIHENGNDGKTFAFLDWSFKHALVPPPTLNNQTLTPITDRSEVGLETRLLPEYDNMDHGRAHRHGWARLNAFEARRPADHDPKDVDGTPFISKAKWVRPDYVVKAHDDSFLMLAELEARLRRLPRTGVYWGHRINAGGADYHSGEAYALSWDLVGHVSTYARRDQSNQRNQRTPFSVQGSDSYDHRHQKDRHDGSGRRPQRPPGRGWRRKYQNLALTISGQEDLVTAGWMKEHGERWGVTWYDEQCWIYDHPSAGTIYSRGFLFPLEVHKIIREWIPLPSPNDDPDVSGRGEKGRERRVESDSARPEIRRRYDAAYSTVTRGLYGRSYPLASVRRLLSSSTLPSPASSRVDTGEWSLERAMEMDALVEGSKLSMVVAGIDSDEEIASRWKEDIGMGWKGLYMLQIPDALTLPLGGTVVVHHVKSSIHWKECVDVLLLGWERERKLKDPPAP